MKDRLPELLLAIEENSKDKEEKEEDEEELDENDVKIEIEKK